MMYKLLYWALAGSASGGASGPGGAANAWLMEDGVSGVLMEDSTSDILMEG